MPVENICIERKPFVIMPRDEYEEMLARAGGTELPAYPKVDKRGNRPAKESVRVMIARDIITRRLAAGWTQEELARRAGVSSETISRLEGAKHKPQAATVEKVESAFEKAGV